jgi:hypothetical protein
LSEDRRIDGIAKAKEEIMALIARATIAENAWEQARMDAVQAHEEVERLTAEKRRQLALLTAIREMADAETGIDRLRGDARDPGALGAVQVLVAAHARLQEILRAETASGRTLPDLLSVAADALRRQCGDSLLVDDLRLTAQRLADVLAIPEGSTKKPTHHTACDPWGGPRNYRCHPDCPVR